MCLIQPQSPVFCAPLRAIKIVSANQIFTGPLSSVEIREGVWMQAEYEPARKQAAPYGYGFHVYTHPQEFLTSHIPDYYSLKQFRHVWIRGRVVYGIEYPHRAASASEILFVAGPDGRIRNVCDLMRYRKD